MTSTSARRYLVYTCAGANSNVRGWLTGPRNFDLWVNDYGADPTLHRDLADHHTARAGKKFPNLLHFTRAHPELLAAYDAVFVADDDLVIDAEGISRLFELRAEHDLWLLQPGFLPEGRISHVITRAQPGSILRWTNFVEVTCPLFRRDRLTDFLAVYDAELVGWGIDWWYLEHFGPDLRGRVAIIDSVPCVNPYPAQKPQGAETSAPAFSAFHRDRQLATWEAVRRRRGITSEARGFRVYDRLWEPGVDTAWKRLRSRGLRSLSDYFWLRARDLKIIALGWLGRGPAGFSPPPAQG